MVVDLLLFFIKTIKQLLLTRYLLTTLTYNINVVSISSRRSSPADIIRNISDYVACYLYLCDIHICILFTVVT